MPTTNNRVREAFEEYRAVRVLDSDPAASELDGGEVWFNTNTSEWRAYDGSSFGTIGFTTDGA